MGVYGRLVTGKEKRGCIQLFDDRRTDDDGGGSKCPAIVDRGFERSIGRKPDRSTIARHRDPAALACEAARQGPLP